MNALKIFLANLYDLLLLAAIWIASAVPFVALQGGSFDNNPTAQLAYQLFLIAITYLYLSFFWTSSGQTPGLRTWKLQLLDENESPLNRHQANIRFLSVVFLFWIGWIGLFFGKKQLLQDRLSKTKIVPVFINDN